MRSNILAGVGGLALSLVFAAPTFAAGGAAPGEPVDANTFGQLDIDNDGVLTRQEFSQIDPTQARWNDIDADKNDLVDRSEFSALETVGGPTLIAPSSGTPFGPGERYEGIPGVSRPDYRE